MSQAAKYISRQVIEQKSKINELEERQTATICPIVRETLGRQLEKEDVVYRDLLRLLAVTQPQ